MKTYNSKIYSSHYFSSTVVMTMVFFTTYVAYMRNKGDVFTNVINYVRSLTLQVEDSVFLYHASFALAGLK